MWLETARASMGFRDLVQCATVSSKAYILGYSVTLGGGTTLEYGVYLGGNGITGIVVGKRNFLVAGRRAADFLIAASVNSDMYVTREGMGVLGILLVNSSCSL